MVWSPEPSVRTRGALLGRRVGRGARVATLIAGVVVAACRATPPAPVPPPSAAASTASEAPAADVDRALELRREAKWRLLEWDLALDVQWSQRPTGEIVLCPADSACDAHAADRYADLAALQEAIDALAARHWAAADEPPLMAIRGGVPEVLGALEDEAQIRDIDRMFWALTVLDLYFTDADAEPGWALAGVSLPEANTEIDWLAQRYGLERQGRLDYAGASSLAAAAELPADDLVYGVFVRPSGSEWLCALDAPPGKYCCYVYCDELDGEDGLAEGH